MLYGEEHGGMNMNELTGYIVKIAAFLSVIGIFLLPGTAALLILAPWLQGRLLCWSSIGICVTAALSLLEPLVSKMLFYGEKKKEK